MKKLVIIAVAILYSSTALWAQEPAERKDTIATFKVENSDDVVLSSNDGTVSINVAGYSIGLSQRKNSGYDARQLHLSNGGLYTTKVQYEDPGNPTSKVTKRKISTVSFASNSQLGVIMLTSPDYSAYGAADQGFLDLRWSKSIYYGLDLVGLHVPLDPKEVVTLKTGVNLMCYNFTFDSSITLNYTDGAITPTAIDSSYKKSKLTTAYASIPLSLSIKVSKKFTIEPGVYAGLLINSHTKYKSPKVKSDYLKGVNQAVAGASLAVTYDGVGIYCNYNATSLFEQGRGPETQAISFGIGFKL